MQALTQVSPCYRTTYLVTSHVPCPACPELNVIAAFHSAEAQSASLT